jgi:hypothetical protein
MAQDDKLDALTKQIEALSKKVDELAKGSDKESKKDSDSDLAAAAALLPLYGLTFASPLLLPFGLRLAAARTLVLHRALERAATITKELAKGGGDDKDQAFKWMMTRTPDEKKALVELMKMFWSK